MLGSLLSLALLTASSANEALPSVSDKIDPATTLILYGTRHGNRNPETYLPENPRSWGYEGNTELTSIGKRQGYGLGHELRTFIGNLTSNNYNSSEVKYYSSSANRCQMTLQVAVAGMHPPETWSDWNPLFDHWSPIPYSINDPLLRMYNEKCKTSDDAWAPISNDKLPFLKKTLKNDHDVLAYAQKNTGWKTTTNLGTAADLADNLIEISLYNATYPDWILKPTIKGYTFESLKKKYLSYAEIHQNACAEYGPCREMMGGLWLQTMLDALNDKKNGKSKLKVIGFASHTEVTLSVMKLLGIDKDELTTSAGFVIEYKPTPTPSVRLLNHDPNPIDKHVIYKANVTKDLQKLQDANGFIPLEKYVKVVSPLGFSDYQAVCTGKKPLPEALVNSSSFLMYPVLLLAMLLF